MSAFWAFTEHGAAGDLEGVALGGADALRKLVEVRVAVLVAVDGTQGAHSDASLDVCIINDTVPGATGCQQVRKYEMHHYTARTHQRKERRAARERRKICQLCYKHFA